MKAVGERRFNTSSLLLLSSISMLAAGTRLRILTAVLLCLRSDGNFPESTKNDSED